MKGDFEMREYKRLIIVYSVDDHGWYAQDPANDWKTSQIFFTFESLICAINTNQIIWEV